MATPPAFDPPTDSQLDLRYYAGLLWRSRVFIAAMGFVGLGLAFVVALLQTPQYQAAAMLQIEPPTPSFMTVGDAVAGMGNYWQNADFYNTQFRVLKSKSTGQMAVERLKLNDRAPFKDNPEAGALFVSHIGVEPVPESRLVNVTVTHQDPKEAALWANTLAAVYIEQNFAVRVEAARKATDWLQERLGKTQQGMRDAQDRLAKTNQALDVPGPEGGAPAGSGSIAQLNDDYVAPQARRISIQAALKQFTGMRQTGKSLDAIPQVAGDAVVGGLNAQLAGLTADLSRLKGKYKEGHPQGQKVHNQTAQLQTPTNRRRA